MEETEAAREAGMLVLISGEKTGSGSGGTLESRSEPLLISCVEYYLRVRRTCRPAEKDVLVRSTVGSVVVVVFIHRRRSVMMETSLSQ